MSKGPKQEGLNLFASESVSDTVSFRIDDRAALEALVATSKEAGFKSHHLFAKYLTLTGIQHLAAASAILNEISALKQDMRDARIDVAVVAEALLIAAGMPADKARAWVREKLNLT